MEVQYHVTFKDDSKAQVITEKQINTYAEKWKDADPKNRRGKTNLLVITALPEKGEERDALLTKLN